VETAESFGVSTAWIRRLLQRRGETGSIDPFAAQNPGRKPGLDERLAEWQERGRENGKPIPAALPHSTPLFSIPSGVTRIFDRDLAAAGIPKRDERNRVVDIHAFRVTFGTHLSAAGVSLRTAQAAMRHSKPELTANIYTDPKLLDVAGAIDALPALTLPAEAAATGTSTARPRPQSLRQATS
jgi:hypothetical protein